MQRVFIIRGFGEKSDSKGNKINFDTVQAELIDPALKACGLAGGTTGEIKDAGNIRADMFALILEADLVICDITVHNANVFYELGIRHALRKKHTLLLKGDPSADTTPFDLSTDRYLKYPVADPKSALPDLIEKIKVSLVSSRETDSPIFLMLPKLSEADAAEVRVVPLDFIEEVKRAQVASDKGALRVIAQDLAGERFQWEGLRLVGRAQWSLKDYAGSRESWETVLDAAPQDVEACLAMANILERLYRKEQREALLETSNQMIGRVLSNPQANDSQRAEAYGLEGRNHKTLWRERFAAATDTAQALALALDERAIKSYKAYRKAVEFNLNAYYPAVASLQMGHILLKLAELPDWVNLFQGDEDAARREFEDVKKAVAELDHVVEASVRRAKVHGPASDLTWAELAGIDLQYLRSPEPPSPSRIAMLAQNYASKIPPSDQFARDAVIGQLNLFESLGIRSAAATAIISAVREKAEAAKVEAPEHLVVFAGHGLDMPGMPRRFPAEAEPVARRLISDALIRLKQQLPTGRKLTVLASAGPGADILAHEVCGELGIDTRLCLPMPVQAVAARAFAETDAWRKRFRAIAEKHEKQLLLMSEQDELPRWLATRNGIDVWERGNRWVMAMAQAWGAPQLTLLALWDGKDDGHNGGTAHMVRMARAAGNFDVDTIDSAPLAA